MQLFEVTKLSIIIIKFLHFTFQTKKWLKKFMNYVLNLFEEHKMTLTSCYLTVGKIEILNNRQTINFHIAYIIFCSFNAEHFADDSGYDTSGYYDNYYNDPAYQQY